MVATDSFKNSQGVVKGDKGVQQSFIWYDTKLRRRGVHGWVNEKDKTCVRVQGGVGIVCACSGVVVGGHIVCVWGHTSGNMTCPDWCLKCFEALGRKNVAFLQQIPTKRHLSAAVGLLFGT